jgi:hypothetical protein
VVESTQLYQANQLITKKTAKPKKMTGHLADQPVFGARYALVRRKCVCFGIIFCVKRFVTFSLARHDLHWTFVKTGRPTDNSKKGGHMVLQLSMHG